MGKQDNPHVGHRQRKKEEFLLRGISGKPEHEMLEILLFYSVPRGDTNEIAHSLVDHFGSLRGVINAPFEELIKIKGISEHSASLICFTRMFAKEYLKSENMAGFDIRDNQTLIEYCRTLFLNSSTEEVRCVFLDDRLKLIGEAKVCEGTLGKVNMSYRKIMDELVKAKANRLVLAHNHPNGSCLPSRDDINATVGLWKALAPFEIEFIDHVIVAKDGERSLRHSKTLPQIWRD